MKVRPESLDRARIKTLHGFRHLIWDTFLGQVSGQIHFVLSFQGFSLLDVFIFKFFGNIFPHFAEALECYNNNTSKILKKGILQDFWGCCFQPPFWSFFSCCDNFICSSAQKSKSTQHTEVAKRWTRFFLSKS